MPLIKPGRWSWDRSLLESRFQGLARGLVDLLPFWDDAATNVADGHFDGEQKYGWVEGSVAWQSKQEPTSHGVGWLNNGTTNTYVVSDRDLGETTEGDTDWTHLFVVRVDSSVLDSGLHGWDGTNQFWFDRVGNVLRMGTQTTAGVIYGSEFHDGADNGTTYVIVYRNDHAATRTDVLVDGVTHVSVAGRVDLEGNKALYVGGTTATGKPLNGVLVEFVRWNRALTDTEMQQVSADPFGLLRPALLETEAGLDITPGLITQLATVFDPTITTDVADITPGLITQAATVTDPAITTTVDITPGLITQAATVFDPVITTTVDIAPGLITQAATVFDPVITTGVVDITPGLVSQLATVSDPVLTTGVVDITPGLITQTATTFDPVITTGVVDITPALIAQLATVFATTITTGAFDITPALITQLATLFDPVISTITITWTGGSMTTSTTGGSMTTTTIGGNMTTTTVEGSTTP